MFISLRICVINIFILLLGTLLINIMFKPSKCKLTLFCAIVRKGDINKCIILLTSSVQIYYVKLIVYIVVVVNH